jgi:hypothetical protein
MQATRAASNSSSNNNSSSTAAADGQLQQQQRAHFFSAIADSASRKCANESRRSCFALAFVKMRSQSVRERRAFRRPGHSLQNFINMNESIVSWYDCTEERPKFA